MQYHPHPPHATLRPRSQTKNFYVKVFRTSLFRNSVVYLFHVWHGDRCWSKILCSTMPTPVYDFKIKVTDLFLNCIFLQFQFFRKAFNGIYGLTIEPYLKFYAVPSPSQYMALRSRSRTLIFFFFFFVKFLQCLFLQSL